MRIPIHVIGEHDQREQARFPPSHGKVISSSKFMALQSHKRNVKATEPSRRLYATFLDALKASYKTDKIQGELLFLCSTLISPPFFKDGRFGAMMSVNLTNEVF
jgi:D-Tyr-tRNAtyr deacylase